MMGMPLGWLADRVHRGRLIAAGMALWTLMTILSGFAGSFGTLALYRVGVGIGEAALVPAAVSMLADSFDERSRAFPLAVFTSGVALGSGLALVAGGALIALTKGGLPMLVTILPGIAARPSWQQVLILAGSAGVPVAAAILLFAEPRRTVFAQHGTGTGLFAYLTANRGLFVPLLTGSALAYLISNALGAWMPSLFVRGFGWSAGEVGTRMGSVIIVVAFVGNLCSGAIATTLVRRGRRDGAMLVMAGGALLLAPLAISGPLATSAVGAEIGIGAIYFAIALTFGVATTSFAAVTPPGLRGRMVALYLLIGNLVGLGLGPPTVGAIVTRAGWGTDRIGPALALVGLLSVVPGAALLVLAQRRYRAVAERTSNAKG
jgi:MFS family permease